MKSFLQSHDWAEFQESIGHSTWMIDNGKMRALIIEHALPLGLPGQGKNYLYVPYGPVISFDHIRGGLRDEVNGFIQHVRELAKKQKSIFVKVEPQSDVVMELIYRRGFKRSKKSIQPNKTVIVDLKKSESELSSAMHHKTRYNVNLALKKSLDFQESDDVKVFWKMLKRTSEVDKFHTHNEKYYKHLLGFFSSKTEIKTKLVLVSSEGKPIAGAILLLYENTAYYLHGAMDRDYKNLMAPYKMHWEIMIWAKSQGYEFYDLWGIDANKWPGVTRFKLGWGGRLVEYPGSFDMPISSFWYFMYRLIRKLR